MTEQYSVGSEIDYDDEKCIYGEYEHRQVTNAEALGNFQPNSGQTMTFQILGSNVCNLNKSYLEFELSVDAQGANTYLWMMAGCIPMFRAIAFMPVGGQQQYIDMYHHYSKMTLPYLLSYEEMIALDSSSIFCANKDGVFNPLPASDTSPSENVEIQYAFSLDSSTPNTASTYVFRIPFKLFAGTILAENRDHCFGQAVNIQFTFEDVNKWIWTSDTAADPTHNAAALTVKTNFSIRNPYLWLAVEQRPELVRKVIEMANQGYRCKVPCITKLYQQSISGTAQTINAPTITRGYGEKLLRIFTSAFAGTENLNTSLDNANNTINLTSVATNRVITFQTLMDSNVRQQNYIYASPSVLERANTSYDKTVQGSPDDWYRYHEYLETSCLTNQYCLGLNWVFVDEWTHVESRLRKYAADGHKDEGLNLSLGDHTWQFLSTNASATYNWYVYIQCLKTMTIAPGILSIQ